MCSKKIVLIKIALKSFSNMYSVIFKKDLGTVRMIIV